MQQRDFAVHLYMYTTRKKDKSTYITSITNRYMYLKRGSFLNMTYT